MSLNSVVGNTYTSQWEAERLQSGDILIHFHDKYWGVTMEGEQANEDEGENEDGSEDEDHIIDGCHALDIDIPGMESSIWVRAEYKPSYLSPWTTAKQSHVHSVFSSKIVHSSLCMIIYT